MRLPRPPRPAHRLLLALTVLGLLLPPGPARASTGPSAEASARALLDRAARAGQALGYRGTQSVAAERPGARGAHLLDVVHRPGSRAVVRGPAAAPAVTLDEQSVALLARTYRLRIAGTGRCTGRPTSVVEARRPGGSLAGRFEVDERSGLLLRREVYDDRGRRVSSRAFVDLVLHPGGPSRAAAAPASTADVRRAAEALRAQGRPVPAELPHGFRLVAARPSTAAPVTSGQVVHLAYSDGLSTTSLFVQPGRLGTTPPDGFRAASAGRRPVWVRSEAVERAVWSGDGHVWTLVSDAPPATVRATLAALPRDPAPSDGVQHRLRRGLARLLGVLDRG